MEVGIVGLPVSGKTTLFSTLTGLEAKPTFSSGKIEVHRGIVKVPDERLDKLTAVFNPRKKVPATIEYIEVSGMDGENNKDKGFSPQFLQVLKNTDALCVVIQGFENEFVPHPAGSIHIERDIQIIESEFLLSDLSIIENRTERLEKQLKKIKDDQGLKELELLNRCKTFLETEHPLRELDFNDEEQLMLRGFQFLSAKPLVIVINIHEEDIVKEAEIIARIPPSPRVAVLALCAKAEQEISQLSPEDREIFLEELKIAEPALNKLIRISFDLLGLLSFFTVGDDECRAWNIRRNTPAPKAAGAIHTDLERGFIRSEVINYKEFVEIGDLNKSKEKGLLRLEGKNYIVQDGDIMTIRFNI